MHHQDTFQRAADRIRASEFVVPVFLIFFVLWLMSVGFAIEDYWTSYWGYMELPTQVGFAWTAYLVAGLPSVGQIAAGYIALALGWESNGDKKYTVTSLLIWFVLFFIDVYTDLTYRIDGQPLTPSLSLAAIFQTVGVFTFGSEIAFVVGFGMSIQLLPEGIGQLWAIPARLNGRLRQLRGGEMIQEELALDYE